ncbi:MAG: hypothetical protein ACI4F5_01590 [Acutalibacteraceae bacterium]
MDNKCPKCGEKLSIFYLKETCPHCGANIMYYNMDKRLEEDAAKAEAEYEKLSQFLDKITPKFIKKRMQKKKEEEESSREEEKIGVSVEE